jgi:hypothetical protein
MKVFRVVVERDGNTINEPGVVSTEVRQDNYRYAADTIEQVWDAIDWLRNDPERTVIAVVEEFPAITVLP